MECAETASEHKSDQEIEAFESRIDNVHLNLELLKYPKNLVLWSLVTNGLERLYQPQNAQVSVEFLCSEPEFTGTMRQYCARHSHNRRPAKLLSTL